MINPQAKLAGRVLALLDLTSLNSGDDMPHIVQLCRQALTPYGNVAAVCVAPRFVHVARRTLNSLGGRAVRVASVCNFPAGDAARQDVLDEVRRTLSEGADEIELVYPWQALRAGQPSGAVELIRACKALCGPYHRLTVILESGELGDPALIRTASREAIAGGADFLKTSTGKASVQATPEAARVMLDCIVEAGAKVGFKACGGLPGLADAQVYLALAESLLRAQWVSPEHLRFTDSALLDDLLRCLAAAEQPIA